MPIRIAINGFGRIGRQLARIICSEPKSGVELVAINTLEDAGTAVHLLKHDSIQGIFTIPATARNKELYINNFNIPIFHKARPANIPWPEKTDIVIECSGHFTHDRQAAGHLESGAQKVIISAAATAPDITICMGVNHDLYNGNHHNIISGSSCTTNCLAPLAKAVNDIWGIKNGLASFIHSSTNSQHLLDTVDKDPRRARAAGLNLIPSTTSAARQIPLVIPQLTNKFDALAIRIPTPDVHLVDFSVQLMKSTSRLEFLEKLTDYANKNLKKIMRLEHEPLVSIDFRNSHHSCIIDAEQTIVQGDMVKIIAWHANEFAYCQRLIDLANFIGKT